jgi:hypothetical protein
MYLPEEQVINGIRDMEKGKMKHTIIEIDKDLKSLTSP